MWGGLQVFSLGHVRKKADFSEDGKKVKRWGGRRNSPPGPPHSAPPSHNNPPAPLPSRTRHPIISSGDAVPAVGTRAIHNMLPHPTATPPTWPPLSHMQPVPSPLLPLWPPKALPAHNTLASGRRRPPAHNIPFHHHPPFPPRTPSSRLQLEPGLTNP